jgi:hypothetical protein
MRKSEDAANSNRVLRFLHDAEVAHILAAVQTLMRNKLYTVPGKVTVDIMH